MGGQLSREILTDLTDEEVVRCKQNSRLYIELMAGIIPIARLRITSGRDILVDGRYLTFKPISVPMVINAVKGNLDYAVQVAELWKSVSAQDESSTFYREACLAVDFLKGIK